MILIVTTDKDQATTHVIDWLYYYNAKYIIINENVDVKIDKLIIKNDKISVLFLLKYYNKGKQIKEIVNLDHIKSIWYRRFTLGNFTAPFNLTDATYDLLVKDYFKNEIDVVKKLIWRKLNEIYHINLELDNNIDKLYQLDRAILCKLNVPYTFISSFSINYKKYNGGNYITKAINEAYILNKNKRENVASGTNIFKMNGNEPEIMIPSLIQKKIEKEFELRVFFIDNNFYASVIFSQSNIKTQIDFRNYDFAHPNRVVPFNLPKEITDKLKKLMKLLNLNSGSIDLIVDINGNYIFLEVNPIGQFDQVAYPCNYPIYQLLAKKLINGRKR